MYKRYLHRYFLNYTITIDQAMVDFLKHRSCDCGNTIQNGVMLPVLHISAVTAGTMIYGDSLYGNLYVIPICYVELGI